MFISQEIGPGACCWHVLLSGSGAGQQKTTRRGFYGSPILQARGLGAAKLLDADSCEDRRQENSSLRAMTFGSFIPNLGIWIQGSVTAGHLTSTLIFQIFGR